MVDRRGAISLLVGIGVVAATTAKADESKNVARLMAELVSALNSRGGNVKWSAHLDDEAGIIAFARSRKA